MIAVDTSALIALLLSEPGADRIEAVLRGENRFVMSAGTLAETLVVSERLGFGGEVRLLLGGMDIEVDALDASRCGEVADAHAAWGKGMNPAGLNFGDCFAYVTAKAYGAPLLYVGNDFARTDIASAMHDPGNGVSGPPGA